MIKVNHSSLAPKTINALLPELAEADRKLVQKSGAGSEYTGWVTLPEDYDKFEFARIQQAAEKIQSRSQVLLIIGIGGSYLGARAAIEFLASPFYNNLPKQTPEIYFVGNNLSGDYIRHIISVIGDRDFSINVISKSGTTTEPAVAFRIFKERLERKYGKDGARERIYVTTDKTSGILKTMSSAAGYETFVVPDDIGGRYSVLSAVGLLPIAAAGIDISVLMRGAHDMMMLCRKDKTLQSPAFAYAAARAALYKSGKKVEILATYDPDFSFLAEWWKQLFGESEGKQQRGLFPASVNYTADLHSMGQYLQDGERILIETMLTVSDRDSGLAVPNTSDNTDGLSYLAGKSVDSVNTAAFQGTYLAHTDGGVPVVNITINDKSARELGQIFYFFQYACGLSGYMLGVNPFDQPGVEAYKKNMFSLLGKPGYESQGKALRARLQKESPNS